MVTIGIVQMQREKDGKIMDKWVRKGSNDELFVLDDGEYACSNCGFKTDNEELKHCPRCGHEMEKENSDENL